MLMTNVVNFMKPILASNKIFYDGHDYKIYIMAHHIHTILEPHAI